MSARSYGTTGPMDCDGQGARQGSVNQLFEAGIPFFKSSGNYDDESPGHGSASCNVNKPAGALGAFTVGALDSPTGGKRDSSSHGSTLVSARRTLLDMAADGWYSPTYVGPATYGGGSGGTSISAPVVTGAAMVYRDHYESLTGAPTFIRIPDVLYTRLYLQADRSELLSGGAPTTDESVGTVGTIDRGFSPTFGAGRLQMRPIYERVGSTSTFERTSVAGSVCLGDDQFVAVPLHYVSGGYTGHVTLTTRFHHPGHAIDGRLDEVDVSLAERTGGPTAPFHLMNTDLTREEKARVSYTASSGRDVYMLLQGIDVSGGDQSCPPAQRRIYYAYTWE